MWKMDAYELIRKGPVKYMLPERIKLLQFLTFFAVGGTERQVINLVQHMDPSRFELHFACFGRWGLFLKEVEALHIPVNEYKVDCLYNHRALFQRLRFARYLRQHHIQVLHTYGFYSTVFALPAAKLAGVPAVIVSIRDTGETLTAWQKRVMRLVCRMADSILVNADAVQSWLLEQGYKPDNISVIPNGIAVDRFTRRGDAPRIRQELGIPHDAPVVTMVSRLNRLKGTEYFLEAAAALASSHPTAHFLIVGDVNPNAGTYKEEMEALAHRLGIGQRVIFTGFRLDVRELLSETTISVLPSLSEGLSNVVIESMAAGLPVIATQVGGNPELIEHGVTGMLIPPCDSRSLEKALGWLLENPDEANKMGRAGKRRATECFSLEAMVRRTQTHYVHLLERAEGRRINRHTESCKTAVGGQ